MIYLYVKIHNKTGLKYLGKTISKDPYKYTGSGTFWLRHIKKHGYDVTTKILLETEDKSILKETGLYYSKLWNIVESKDWANLKMEEGDGGNGGANKGKKLKRSDQWKLNLRGKRGPQKNPCQKRKPQSEKHKLNLSKAHKFKKWYNNGIITKTFYINQQPENWIEGRLPFKVS